MYINFMLEPDIAYATTTYIGYSTPNEGAYEKLSEEEQEDEISYPPDEFLENKTMVFQNLSDEANLKMQTLWTEMKSSEDEVRNQWIVPMFMLACVLLSIGILIRRYIKKKKDIF